MADVNGLIIFCDDVREEAGGKSSYMGLSGSEIWVDEVPSVLPRFVIAFLGRVRGTDHISARITVEIIGSAPEPLSHSMDQEFRKVAPADDEWFIRINLAGPIPVADGTVVRARCEIGTFVATSELKVHAAAQQDLEAGPAPRAMVPEEQDGVL